MKRLFLFLVFLGLPYYGFAQTTAVDFYHLGLGAKGRQAIDYFTKAIEKNPEKGSYYIARGDIYLSNKMLEQAIGDYKKGIELGSEKTQLAGANNNIGVAYYRLGKSKEAIEFYQKAIEVLPEDNYLLAHRNMGVARMTNEVKDYKRAIEDFNRVVDINDNYTAEKKYVRMYEVYNDRGVAYSKLGKIVEAERDYKKSIELSEAKNPKYIDNYKNLCLLYSGKAKEKTWEGLEACKVAMDKARKIYNRSDKDIADAYSYLSEQIPNSEKSR